MSDEFDEDIFRDWQASQKKADVKESPEPDAIVHTDINELKDVARVLGVELDIRHYGSNMCAVELPHTYIYNGTYGINAIMEDEDEDNASDALMDDMDNNIIDFKPPNGPRKKYLLDWKGGELLEQSDENTSTK